MSDEAKAQRDWWDKAEICSKILGAVIIPVIVAGVALFWNSQSSSRQSAAQMSAIAIGILQAEPKPGVDISALREWAVAVLQTPTHPPALSEGAADELRRSPLPATLADEKLRTLSDHYRSGNMSTEDYTKEWLRLIP